jgi:hypothetical protein
MHVCIRTRTRTYIHTQKYMHARMLAHMHSFACTRRSKSRQTKNADDEMRQPRPQPQPRLRQRRCLPCVCVRRVCPPVCVYLCVYIYAHTYICICIYIYRLYTHIQIHNIYPHIYAYLCVSNRKCHRGQSQQSWQSWVSPWRCRQLSATSTAPAATSQPPSVRLTTRPNSSRRRVRKYVQAHCGTRGHTARLAQSRACACRASYLYPIYIGFVHT